MTIVKWKKPVDNGSANNSLIFGSPFSGLFENFFGENFLTKEYASFVPAINVAEEDNQFSLELFAPGFEKDNFKIELDNGVISISGKHVNENTTEEKNFTRKEFNYGSFQRSFTMPDAINEEAIIAKYENGILKITLPKNEVDNKRNLKQIIIS